MPDINAALILRFALTRPLIFEDIEHGHEVITEPTRTVIRSDAESLEQDLPEMLSIAKLAETDPLLGTFYSQTHPTERELKYLGQFSVLCAPLKNAWVWRTMRQTVPDVYVREMEEMTGMFEQMHDRLIMQTGGPVNIDDPEIRAQMLGMWAIQKQDPDNKVSLLLTGNRDMLPAWHRYLAVLESFIPLAPDPLLYTILPDVTEADYRVRIISEGSGRRVYDIRERKRPDVIDAPPPWMMSMHASVSHREALDHLRTSINLMEQSKGAVKSKTIAQARDHAEKARALLEKLL